MAMRGLTNTEIDELAEMMRAADEDGPRPNVFEQYVGPLLEMKQENAAGTSPQGEELQREFLAGVNDDPGDPDSLQFYIARALCLVAGEIRAHRFATVQKLEDVEVALEMKLEAIGKEIRAVAAVVER